MVVVVKLYSFIIYEAVLKKKKLSAGSMQGRCRVDVVDVVVDGKYI